MSTYEELPRHHLRSTLDLVASTPASDYRDSTETPETEPHVTTSQRRNPSDDLQQPHIPPSYYYFGASDSDSADDTYDHTPPHVELPAERDDPQFLAYQGTQLEQIRELQDRLDEE
jgi:hypothetical protein